MDQESTIPPSPQELAHLRHPESPEQDPLTAAKEKVTRFVTEIYHGNIPPDLNQRLIRLNTDPTAVIVSDINDLHESREDSVDSKIYQNTTGGYYSPKTDDLHLPENGNELTNIHEMLHFLSARPNPDGIRHDGIIASDNASKEDMVSDLFIRAGTQDSQSDPLHRRANEAVTDILAFAAYLQVDINSTEASSGLFTYLSKLKGNAAWDKSLEYQNYIVNTTDYLSKLNPNNLLADIASSYLEANPEKFSKTISRHGLLAQPNEYFEAVKKLPQDEVETIKSFFSGAAASFESDPRFTDEQKKYVRLFANSIDGQVNQAEVNFQYLGNSMEESLKPGEKHLGSISITPGETTDKSTKIPSAEMSVSLGLSEYMQPNTVDSPTGKKTVSTGKLNFECQVQFYMLWQGIKLQQAIDHPTVFSQPENPDDIPLVVEADGLIADIELPNHPVVLDYLSRLNRHEVAYIDQTAKYFFDSDLIENLLSSNRDVVKKIRTNPDHLPQSVWEP